MGTIADKLQKVADSKATITAALVAKEQTMTDVLLSGFAAIIGRLQPATAIPNTTIKDLTVVGFIADAVLTNPEASNVYTYTLPDTDYAGLEIIITSPVEISSPLDFDETVSIAIKFTAGAATLDLHNLCLLLNDTVALSYVVHYEEGGAEVTVTQSLTLPGVSTISLIKLR